MHHMAVLLCVCVCLLWLLVLVALPVLVWLAMHGEEGRPVALLFVVRVLCGCL